MTEEINFPKWFKEKYKIELETPTDYINEETKEIIIRKEHRFWVEMEDVKKLWKEKNEN